MNKKVKDILWGLVLIAVGIFVTLEILDLGFTIFFDGWWTLFIIVPCTIGLFTEKNKFGNLFCILIGIGLFFVVRDKIDLLTLGKLLVPVLLILLGIHIIFRTFFQKKQTTLSAEAKRPQQTTGKTDAEYTSMFSGDDINYNGQLFEGTSLTALFGGIECDLRGAIITHDVEISATAIFGGIDIFVPTNVRINIDSSASFCGGVSNKAKIADASAPCITIRSTGIFGGIEIK